MEGLNKKIIFVAIILALITTFVGYRYINSVQSSSTKAVEDKKIIVAAVDIPARTKINADMITEIKVPADSYLINALQSKDQIIGMYTKDKILEGEVIPKERLIEDDKKELSLRIPEGKRAVTVFADKIIGVADLIKPGDYVDVFVTLDEKTIDNGDGRTKTIYPQITKVILQKIQVLAISKEMNRTENTRSETPERYSVTLALTLEESEKIILAEDMGRLRLALRPLEEDKTYNTNGSIRNDISTEKGKMIVPK